MDWSTCATSVDPKYATKPLTLADLTAMVEEIDRKYPPLPPPDPHHCANCKDEMSKPAMPVTSDAGVCAPIIGYLCGRCAVVFKREHHYKLRFR